MLFTNPSHGIEKSAFMTRTHSRVFTTSPVLAALITLVLLYAGASRLYPVFAAQAPEISFTHLSLEQGLSQVTVNGILQDRRGFMWFGTGNGLNRYDGYTFTVYKHHAEDPTSIGGNAIYALHEDRAGTLWIGTDDGGLNALNPVIGTFTRYQHDPENPETLSSNAIRTICEDPEGADSTPSTAIPANSRITTTILKILTA